MEKIRLVVWDLDETFWSGTLSEGEVSIPQQNIEIIKELTNRGIVNSICSKNDFDNVKSKLEEYGLWDYFVFPQISWGPKGPAVKKIVEDIKLRPETILFIDDNTTNLSEVEFYVQGINVSSPSIIETILTSPLFEGKDDKKHSRLKQYHVLEAKKKDEEKFDSNEDFLRQSGITVDIITDDFFENIDRLWELNQRTNQLNYTKNRLSRESFSKLLSNGSIRKGYIKVKDNYGDYGIVGFYALENGILTNFYFSCRTIGLGVEQWVYAYLGYPKLYVVGEVATEIKNDIFPNWINVNTKSKIKGKKDYAKIKGKVLLLGGCDLEQTAFYLEQAGVDFVSKFNYLVKGKYECHPDELEAIRGCYQLSSSQKQILLHQCPFIDEGIFDNMLLAEQYNLVVYSPLIDYGQGFYQNKLDKELFVSYGNLSNPDEEGHAYLSKKEIEVFREKFDFIGSIPKKRFLEDLEFLRDLLPSSTVIMIMNGSIQDIEHPQEPNRNVLHEELNDVISSFVNNHQNVCLLDVNQFIKTKSDHTDSIRHYNRKIYFKIAEFILEYLKSTQIADKKITLENVSLAKREGRVLLKSILLRLGLLKIGYAVVNYIRRK